MPRVQPSPAQITAHHTAVADALLLDVPSSPSLSYVPCQPSRMWVAVCTCFSPGLVPSARANSLTGRTQSCTCAHSMPGVATSIFCCVVWHGVIRTLTPHFPALPCWCPSFDILTGMVPRIRSRSCSYRTLFAWSGSTRSLQQGQPRHRCCFIAHSTVTLQCSDTKRLDVMFLR